MRVNLKSSLLVVVLLVSACRQNPSGPSIPVAPPPLAKAVYILNEGNYGDPSGARLSIYDVVKDTVYSDVFEAANNNSHLGSVGDDMRLLGGKAFILMSGSENLDVISLDNNVLLQLAFFPSDTPHDILIDSSSNRAYLTRLYKSSVLVLDLSTLAVVDSISVGNNPQGLALADHRLFVCNSGYGSSKTLTVVDVPADTVKETVTLADGPTGCALSPDGRLWVVCTGNSSGTPSTPGRIFIVNPLTLSVEDSILFTENLWGSIVMGADGYAYVLGVAQGSFYGGPVHRIQLSSRNVSLRFVQGVFYGIAVDTATDDLYVTDARGFAVNGDVLIYTKDGILKNRFTVQRGPSVIGFKR